MKALWLEKQQLSFLEDVPVPSPAPGEALIRVQLAGICSTDLELLKGYLPFTGIPGHEFVGEIVSINEEKKADTADAASKGEIGSTAASKLPSAEIKVGKRVVGGINITCGVCRHCAAGRDTHCEKRVVLGIIDRNGAFTEYLTLPIKNLYPVPDSVSDEAAVFTEPLAAALEIQMQVHIRPAERVLVIGAGRLGLLIARTLTLTGCDLAAVARHDNQRRLLAESRIPSISEKDIVPGHFDIAVEASGSPSGFELARKAVRPRGTIVLKSTYSGAQKTDFSSIVVDEITMVGSRCGPFPPALDLLENRTINPADLIEARYGISDGIKAVKYASMPGVLKVLLYPD
jgi:threonine dehydrogenase-like Zn-dependent dehydrogenase